MIIRYPLNSEQFSHALINAIRDKKSFETKQRYAIEKPYKTRIPIVYGTNTRCGTCHHVDCVYQVYIYDYKVFSYCEHCKQRMFNTSFVPITVRDNKHLTIVIKCIKQAFPDFWN